MMISCNVSQLATSSRMAQIWATSVHYDQGDFSKRRCTRDNMALYGNGLYAPSAQVDILIGQMMTHQWNYGNIMFIQRVTHAQSSRIFVVPVPLFFVDPKLFVIDYSPRVSMKLAEDPHVRIKIHGHSPFPQ